MAKVSKAKVFLFKGTDLRFVNGTKYTISKISKILKVTDGLVRGRIFHLGAFDDTHLRNRKSNARRGMTKSELAIFHTKKARIVKSCVFSETRFLVASDPKKLKKVNSWLDSVYKEGEDFWLSMDRLTLGEILKIAINKDVAA